MATSEGQILSKAKNNPKKLSISPMILEISIPTLHNNTKPLKTMGYIGKIEGIKKYQATKALKPLINSSKTLPQRVRQNAALNRMSFFGWCAKRDE